MSATDFRPNSPSNTQRNNSDSKPFAKGPMPLTDLPLHVISEILKHFAADITHPQNRFLQFACPDAKTGPWNSPSALTKAHVHRSTPLPLALLPLVRTSRTLATALAIALHTHGRRSSLFAVQLNPSAWLTCLAPVLEHFDAGLDIDDICEIKPVMDPLLIPRVFTNVLFPRLRYLDLSRVPAYTTEHLDDNLRKKLSDLTESMLANVGKTLQTLVLPAHAAFVTALAKAKLPLLGSITIIGIESPNEGLSATRVGQMLCGLAEVIAPRTLTEVHLKRMQGAPTFHFGSHEELSNLLYSVTVLTLTHVRNRYREEQDQATLYFLSLFPNLRKLDWNGDSYVSRIRTISRSCPLLQELFLNPGHEFLEIGDVSNDQYSAVVGSESTSSLVTAGPYRGSSSSIDELRTVCDVLRRVKVIVSRTDTVANEVQGLLTNNVPLRQVTITVTKADFGILTGLCRRNSDNLERLCIIHVTRDDLGTCENCHMKDDVWCTISDAVASARSLSELKISGITKSSQDTISCCVEACLISMGDRALKLEVNATCQQLHIQKRLAPILRAHISLLQTVRTNNSRLRKLSMCTEYRMMSLWYRDMKNDDVRELFEDYLSELALTGNALPELLDIGWSAAMAHKYKTIVTL